MFEVFRKEIDWAGRKLVLETGKIARQADAAVLATYGETVVLATVVSAKSPKPGIDFFPLTVNYQEKTFAAGRIPGGYFKREGRPTEKETLVSRLIDRPIRPLFVEGYLTTKGDPVEDTYAMIRDAGFEIDGNDAYHEAQSHQHGGQFRIPDGSDQLLKPEIAQA